MSVSLRMMPLVDWSDVFSFQDYGELVALLANSIIAGAVLGIVGGLIGVFVMQRDLAFAVHGVSELSFAGAAAALLFGGSVVAGSLGGALVAAILIGVLGAKARDRNSIVGVLMPFGLGLGLLFLSLYDGRSANRFSLLTGQIVSVSSPDLGWLIGISMVVLIGLLVMWNPLRFDSLDPESAAARGVPTRAVSLLFMVLCASASYIAVPAAMRMTVPQANPSLYISSALGVTFPFNVVVGIPLYMALIQRFVPLS